MLRAFLLLQENLTENQKTLYTNVHFLLLFGIPYIESKPQVLVDQNLNLRTSILEVLNMKYYTKKLVTLILLLMLAFTMVTPATTQAATQKYTISVKKKTVKKILLKLQ